MSVMKRSTREGFTLRWIERKPVQHLRCFEAEAADGVDLRVFVGREPIGPGGAVEWHLSISTRWRECHFAQVRYPSWDEIAEARDRYLPDHLIFGMILPPRGEYVNLHETTFHLNEMQA